MLAPHLYLFLEWEKYIVDDVVFNGFTLLEQGEQIICYGVSSNGSQSHKTAG